MRVLVVDGSAAVSVRMVALLREARHEVVGMAATAEAALDQAQVLRPDVIVVDPQLSDRSGLEVIAALRERAPVAVLVVLSSDPQPRYRLHCQANGADYFFDKASEFDSVAATLAVAAARSQR
jgi:DNA-binding NarL/FixJ family response regulator